LDLTPQPIAPQVEPLAQGEWVADRFEIERAEAGGGTSIVYRARDRETSAPVAIKVLRGGDATTEQRFASEAEILSTITHPAVVRYIAHGTTRHHARFLAMEWLSGEDLGKRLARVGLRASECLALVRQLCAGLSAAHARGILHRDIKPSNVFLVGGSIDNVKLLDFGVARQEATTNVLTQAGSIVGTVGYMSPEQARGESGADPRTDVFSLGALLFECLTGHAAFSGAHDLAVLAKVLRDPPAAVSTFRPDLSADFDVLFARLLAKEREERPSSVGEALEAIEATFAQGTFDAELAPASRARTSFAEQRILSVIAVRPRSTAAVLESSADPGADASAIDALARELDSEVVSLTDAWVLLPSASTHSAATDQASHAARYALRLAERTHLSVAIATGAVDTSTRVPIGIAIDRALELSAEGSTQIKLDDLTARLLGTRFTVVETEHCLHLTGEVDEGETADVLMGHRTPFVGRTTELAILDANLRESIADGVSRAVLVVGPPGAGKSRLCREFIERTRSAGNTRIFAAGADATAAFSPLGLAQRLIRSAASLRRGDPIEAQRARLGAYLKHTIAGAADEQLNDFLGEIVGVSAQNPEHALLRAARGDPDVMREQKRRAFERWITATVEQGPLLLLLEDLHWADLPSLTFVQDVIRALTNRPLCLLTTARPGVEAQFPHLREQGLFQEVVLPALTKKASERLVRAMLPVTTPESVVAKVVSLAGGNAFYLEELVRRVAKDGSTELPETAVAMAQSRIEKLPQVARHILCSASVFGETVWAGGIDRAIASATESAATLDLLVGEEILKPSADARFPGEREFIFRHALLREAAYAMLTDADRRREHLRAADCLERWGERDPRVLADHFERGGATARALPWIAKASMAALDSGDFENAITLSRRGTSLGAYGDLRGQLLLVSAYASTWKNDPELPDEALSLLPRASAHWWLALSLGVYNSTLMGAPERATPYLQLALTTSPDTAPTSAYGHALQVLATGAALVGRAHVGWALVQQFEHRSQDEQKECDPSFLAWFNLSKCILASNSLLDGEWQLGLALSWGRASIDSMRVLGSRSGEAAALFHYGNALWLAGSFESALSLLSQAVKLGKQTGNRLVEEHAELLLAVAAMRDGSRSEALNRLQNLAISSNLQLSHAASTVLADLSYREGRFEEAIARAQDAARGCALMSRRAARATLARAELGRGHFEAALLATDQAFEEGGMAAFPHLTVDLLGSRAKALLGCDAHDAAALVVRDACKFRDAVAQRIEDDESRVVFRTRGRANRVLDELSAIRSI
jgi:serine/threonine protein kinase/tetratricopeptide (TPR) repeat protein